MATSMIKSRNGGAPGRNREGLWSPESSVVRAAPSRPWRLRKHMHAGQTLGSGSGHGDEVRGKKGMAKRGREGGKPAGKADVTRPIRGGTRNESPKTPRGTPLAHGPREWTLFFLQAVPPRPRRARTRGARGTQAVEQIWCEALVGARPSPKSN